MTNKLYSNLNNLTQSYYLEQAEQAGQATMTLKLGLHHFYDNLCLYCTENEIDLNDVTDDEFDFCAETLKKWARNNQDNQITFSINKF